MTTPAISELGKLAIEGALPVGNEVREEPGFERLEVEVTKLSSPVYSPLVDWGLITQLSSDLLATKGKDLLVACYLTAGLLETRGLAGLSDGLKVIADMLETWWDSLYPSLKRIRGRRNALQWLVDRVQQRAGETGWATLPPQEAALSAQLQASLQAIDAVLLDKDSDAPSIRSLLTLVKALPVAEDTPAPQALPQAPAAGATPSARVAAEAAAQSPLIDSGEQAEHALDEACARLQPIAEWLLNADLSNPLAYRLDRLAAWTPINSLPPDVSGQTQLAGPISQVTDALDRLKADQADEDLVHFAEAQLAAFPFWLDLNCICAAALERLGSGFEAASREVCGESARLVARLPGIEKLAFAGGMPFADGDTIAWLAGLAAAQGSASGPAAVGPQGRSAITAAVGNARALAANDDMVGAVNCLQQQLALVNTPGDQLFLRIRLCELLLLQRPGAALEAFALSLVDSIDRHQLAEWDPALALDGLQVAYKVMTRNEDSKAAADSLLKRVVSLDAAAAVKLVT